MKQRVVHGAELDIATKEEIAELLREHSRAGHVAFGADSIQADLRDWPVKGHKRELAVGRAHGNPSLVLQANAYTDVLPADRGRAGLSIINIGAAPAFIFLADASHAQNDGNPSTGYVAPGGQWDGKISDWLWVGPVSAMSVAGTTLVVAVI